MSSISQLEHRCLHCKKGCKTSPGLLHHIRNTPACATAFNKVLAKHRKQARQYHPDDPESHPRDDEPPVGWRDQNPDMTFDDILDHDTVMHETHLSSSSSKSGHIPFEEAMTDKKPSQSVASLFILPFPKPAGTILKYDQSSFETIHEARVSHNEDFFHPFADQEEWELAQRLMTSGMSMSAIDKILKLPIIRNRCQTSYKNKDHLLNKIDALPVSGTPFMHTTVKVTGDQVDGKGNIMVEELDLFYRDPVECINELISNPAFRECLRYAPEKIFENETCEMRIYNEMHTADWWWETQEKLPVGATIAPVLLASDKTKLSYFSGDKAAWPVYISIGNILKSRRRQPNSHAMILLGYIPVSKLKCFSKQRQSLEGQRLFHYCMSLMLSSMKSAGKEGVEMTCADNGVRLVYPLLAAYIADFPEQCLITCVQENYCPKCPCLPEDRGKPLHSIFENDSEVCRTSKSHLNSARFKHANENDEASWPDDGVRLIIHPFWKDLPHCNIFQCMTPDILHQLHKGVFKDHLTTWCTSLIGKAEMDARFMAMSPHPSLRHFKNGISSVAQWTGTEYKNMEKVFLGVIQEAKGLPPDALSAARALLDFIYLAQFQSHSGATLELLSDTLKRFHRYKNIFIEHGCRPNFQIPKFHSMEHYVDAIKSRGTADSYNTELPERLHIDFAKIPYRGSNKKQYIDQMIKWVTRQEKIRNFDAFLRWQKPTLRELEEGLVEESEDGLNDATTNGVGSLDEEEQEDEDSGRTYQLPKRPAFPNMSIEAVLNKFHTPELVPLLSRFLKKVHPSCSFHVNEAVRLDLYKRASFKLRSIQQLDDQILTDVVRAIPGTPLRGRRNAIPAQYDTVLVHYSHLAQETGALGYRVARLRAIFRLPPHFEYVHPLAYIEWYSDLPNSPVARIEMYRVSKITTGAKAAVIPLDSIRRSCHLIGWERGWSEHGGRMMFWTLPHNSL